MRTYERIIMLNIIDAQWKDHLLSLDHLKQGIGLVGYGQKDPLVEYKKQSFDLFSGDAGSHRHDDDPIAVQPASSFGTSSRNVAAETRRETASVFAVHWSNQGAAPAGEEDGKVKTVVAISRKVGRNEPCPCGSGKKYKKCHGINA